MKVRSCHVGALVVVCAGSVVAQEYGLYAEAPFQVLAYDAPPVAANAGQPLAIAACPGEYEPATFSIHAEQALNDVTITAGPLQNGPAVIAADHIDIRVVKFWYQGGTVEGFGSLVLVPELLLKDDGLIDVDTAAATNVFHFEGVPVDGPGLAPVDVPAGGFKQVWLTVQVPDGAAPGTYVSTVTAAPSNAPAQSIELHVTVLPFALRETDKVYSTYYYGPTMFYYGDGPEGSLAELEDMRAHGLNSAAMHTYYYDTRVRETEPGRWEMDLEPLRLALDRRVAAGLTSPTVFSLANYICRDTAFRRLWTEDSGLTPENEEKLTQVVQQVEQFVRDNNYPQLYYYGVDEPTGPRVDRCTNIFRVIHAAGGKTTTAVYNDDLTNVDAPIYALPMANGLYEDPGQTLKPHTLKLHYWHPLENPSVERFRYGILTRQAGLDGACPYAYRHVFQSDNPYYDESQGAVNPAQNRNMMYTYPAQAGPVPTLHWEAVREGIDDVRYLTTLAHWVDKLDELPDIPAVRQARQDGLDLLNNLPEAFTNDPPVQTDQFRYSRDLQHEDFRDYRGQVIEQILGIQSLFAQVEAATIGLGGAGPYHFGWDLNANADGDLIPQALYAVNLCPRIAGNHESINQETGGTGGEIVFHFQSDPGTLIETVGVESDIRVWWETAGIHGSWSTDTATWTAFVGVDMPPGPDMNYDLIPLPGWTPSRDLFLKYELTGGNPASACLFISDDRAAKDTFVVEGIIGILPTAAFSWVALADTVAMQFLTEVGAVYALERTSDMVGSSAWSGVGSSLIGNGTHMFFFDPHEPIGLSASKAYRIILQ